MSKKNLLWGIGFLIALALVSGFSTTSQAQQGTGENFIFINYIGQELVLDLDDVTYLVPGVDSMAGGGRLALQLADGEHKYAAHAPGIGLGSAGEFTIGGGNVVAKAAEIRQTPPKVDNNGILLEAPRDKVFVFDFDPFAPAAEPAPVVDTWTPRTAAPGQGSIVWVNHSGVDELTIDLAGQLYSVPPKINEIPGRLQVDVAPGFYRYTASVPNGSVNGEITVVAGQVTSLSIVPGIRPEPEYDVGDEFEALPPIDLNLVEEDLTTQANPIQPVQPDVAPAALPTTGGQVAPTVVDSTVKADGLLIKNFAGDTLIFTINGQTYTIAANTEQTLPLAPGQYNYTASLPFVAANGTVTLGAAQTVELSIAINVNHDVLNVYQN
jgi:hypothetical protein